MTTLGTTISSADWIDIVSLFTLEINNAYSLQNISNHPLMIVKSVSKPIDDEPHNLIMPKEYEIIVPKEDLSIWLKAPSAIDGAIIHIAITDDQTAIAKESTGGLPVNIQDQHTRMLDLKFIQQQGAPTTLDSDTVIDQSTIDITSTVGFVADCVIGIFSGIGTFYFGRQIGAPAGNTITLDTPIDKIYPSATSVVICASDNMAVDGSSTTEIFQIGPIGEDLGIEIDITRISGYIQDGSAMDDSKFGGIDAIEKGIVLRRNDGVIDNIWNAKTNGELAEICAGDYNYTNKAPAGSFGARFRNSFAGPEKHGVTIRLEPGDILELLIQDNLTELEIFKVSAQGHIVTD